MIKNPYNMMITHEQGTAAFHKSPVSLMSYKGESNAVWAMRADTTSVQGLADMALKAQLSGNDATAYLSKMMSLADQQGMSPKQLQSELSQVVGNDEAQAMADNFEAVQDAKRPENTLVQSPWSAPSMLA